jgi:hypothetical protein
MTEELIPYIIMEANPDYKRPAVCHKYGKIEKSKLYGFLLTKLVDFVYERIELDELNSVKDVEYFWENFYSESFMSNSPWSAMAVINGEWNDISPTDEELFTALIAKKT